jgi:MFS family permease
MVKNLFRFPKTEIRNVKLFYLIEAGLSFWLVEAVWYFYWAKFASYSLIGIVFAALTLIWILLEVPTGAVADMFGRKLSTKIGCISLLIGSIVMVGAQNIWYLIIGGLFQNIGRAFISGSLEALVYDNLKSLGQESWYDDIVAAKTKINLVMYGVATVAGGFLYLVYFRLPHFLTAVAQVFILICAFFLIEVEVAKRPKVSFKNYLLQNLEGFRQLFKKALRPYIILIIAIMTIFYLYDWGLSKPAMAVSFGYFSAGQGIIYALMAFINVFVVGKLMFLREKVGDLKGIIYLNFLMGLGFMLSVLPWGYFGVVILFLIESVGALSDPWISVIVNRETNSQDRATTLSSLQFLSKLPFIFLILIAGNQIQNKSISNFHLIIGVVLVAIASLYFFINRTKSQKASI